MITVSQLDLVFSDKKLFEDVNIKFLPGNCYGVIGANGSGKSTFLKVLAGEKESSRGSIFIDKGNRMAVLKQDHNEYNEYTAIETVIMGHKELFQIIQAKEALYAKADFSDEDGMKLGELEHRFSELNGWDAEFDVEKLLNGLQVDASNFQKKMEDILPKDKVKILLAQALFGSPDILLLDEPTNHLDFHAKQWLKEFLLNFDKTVITVSHDRHFLNAVCTHMVDIDYYQARLYPGNYDFWLESSQLMRKLMQDRNKKKEQRIEELKAFVARFSANASKSSQATSRKKSLEKINLEEIVPSSRMYPFVGFDIARPLGKDVVAVENLTASLDGNIMFEDLSFSLHTGDKVSILGDNDLAKTVLLRVLAGEHEADSGTIKWGQTAEVAYMPADNNKYFKNNNLNLIEWLQPYSKDPAESYIRGFLGRMLFSGDQPLKKVKYLSGGEKMRCMFSKLMLSEANTLLIDQPTNHLDLESIQSVNKGLQEYKGALIITSHDHNLINTICNKQIVLKQKGSYEFNGTLDHYLERS
uniref:Heme ABC transporter ATP-binding protein n=1 Tax=Firmicutes bacterium enrichment culture clone fosmid MGS-M1 TaxID=1549348 RepID=A0A0B5KNC4_9FIRM|nr:heme ABC transporter ATP-binding protein [Firmicutes bacterium enrichment culture clone fosmid MGS-M1]